MTFPMDLFVAEARLGDERIFVGIIPTAIIHFTCVDQYSFPLETKGSGDTMAESTKANGSS